MAFRGLAWRVGFPILLLALGESLALATLMSAQIAAEKRQQLERVAAADARFLRESGLPLSEGMLRDLKRVTGFDVFLRERGRLVGDAADGAPSAALVASVPADGAVHRDGNLEWAIVPVRDGKDLVLAHTVGSEFLSPLVIEVVLACWVLGLLTAWLVVRGMVRPLRSLAAKLPNIESDAALDVPEAERLDEIGDVARAFDATRSALLVERDERARMEKLALLGRMTASLAHEIQNPISAIKMHAQLLQGSDADEIAGLMVNEAARIESLVQQWMFLSRPEPPALGASNVGDLVDEVLSMLRTRLLHARVDAELVRDGALTLECDARRLSHVFQNLVTNAVQAMPEGGSLRILAQGRTDHVELSFRDTGTGFSAVALDRFGEFFYSEKEGGMGIGLGVAKEIVRAHGGTIRASNTDDGAQVVLVLPRTHDAAVGNDARESA